MGKRKKKCLIQKIGDTEIELTMQDGGSCYIHHNGECLIATYYQNRIRKEDKDIWPWLSEGKAYFQEYYNDTEVTDVMIQDAVEWLGFVYADCVFTRVDTDPINESTTEKIKEFLNSIK